MNSIGILMQVPVLLTATTSSEGLVEAQVKAGAVGGAILGTLIGVGVGLIWLFLTKRRRPKKEEKLAAKTLKKQAKKQAKKQVKKQVVAPVRQQPTQPTQPQQQPTQAQTKQPQIQEKQSRGQLEPQVQPGSQGRTIPQITAMLVTLIDVTNPAQKLQMILEEQVILGRSSERCNVVIKGDESVSGVHCKIYNTKGQLYLVDLASTNGTYVNGIRADQVMALRQEDVIQIGATKYKLYY